MGISVESTNPIEAFLTSLLRAAGVEKLPVEYQEEYRKRLEGQLLERLGLAALAALPASDVPRVEELTKKQNAEGLMQLFQKNVPDFENLLIKTFDEFRMQFVESLSHARTQSGTH